jgi:DNA-binding CsgD family transcriptional regulator
VPSPVEVASASLTAEARRPGDGSDFADSVMAATRRVVGFDGYCLFALDPLTGLRSSMFSRHGLDGVAGELAHNESVERDAHRYTELGAARRPVGVLSASDRHGRRSPRLHDIIRPAGFTSELRLALRSRDHLWGALVLFRAGRPFSEHEADTILALASPLADAVRRYPVRAPGRRLPPLPPGVITLDAANRVTAVSEHAQAWLSDICAGGADQVDVDDVMRVVYEVGLAARTDPSRASCRVRTTSGRWLSVHGEPLESGATVVLSPAVLEHVLPAAAAWLGFTRREHDVVGLAATGLPARHVARRLGLSELTIHDHLRAAYRKAGVSGRQELLARLS